MAITSAGLGSGLDIEGIITKLMTVEAQPLTALTKKEASYQAQLTAYGTLNSAISAFQSAASALGNSASVNATNATSSDTSKITAKTSSIATAGTYSVNVTQLAKAQQLVAAGQTSITSSIGTGTITFDFGTISGGSFNVATGQYTGSTFTSNGNGIKTVTISAANDSLSGIRDAINSANIGVTATIINDGSGTPYRLALSSNNQGASNSIKVSVSPAAGGLDNFISNDPAGTQHLSETVSAQDALLQINGVAVSSKTNAVSTAISGVTLNLVNTTSGTPVTVTVGKDTSAFSKLIDSFVKSYNDLDKTIKDLTSYDPKTKQAGLLIGDALVRSVQSQIKSILGNNIPGLSGTYKNLSDIGLRIAKDGTLSSDSSKLQAALSADPSNVAALFSSIGRTSDPLIKYTSSTGSTQLRSGIVNITNIATQGKAVGSAPVGATTITAGVNDTLSVTVDGVLVNVTLAAGAYTQAGLNSAIQSAINGSTAISGAGLSVAVTDVGGIITVQSNSYGSTSNVTVNGGNAATNLFGAISVIGTAGTDVAGTIGGATATGSGQYLTTNDGLKIQVLGGVTGNRGTFEFTRGAGYSLDALASSYLGDKGSITGKTDGINASIKRIGDQRTALNIRLTAVEKRYRAQFAALDATVSSLNNTSAYLTQQLTALTKSAKSS